MFSGSLTVTSFASWRICTIPNFNSIMTQCEFIVFCHPGLEIETWLCGSCCSLASSGLEPLSQGILWLLWLACGRCPPSSSYCLPTLGCSSRPAWILPVYEPVCARHPQRVERCCYLNEGILLALSEGAPGACCDHTFRQEW